MNGQVDWNRIYDANLNSANSGLPAAYVLYEDRADDKQFIFYDQALAATTAQTVVIGICLGQADVVKVYASAANVSFNLFGVETS